jgi:hypothetical protein
MNTHTFKAAVPIRTLIFAGIIGSFFMFGLVYFYGGYLNYNNVTTNSSLENAYVLISGNKSTQNYVLGNLSTEVSAQGSQLANSTSPIIAITGTVPAVAHFIGSIPAVYGSFTNFASGPLSAVGIASGEANIIVNIIIIAIIVIAILSAIFLFPLVCAEVIEECSP